MFKLFFFLLYCEVHLLQAECQSCRGWKKKISDQHSLVRSAFNLEKMPQASSSAVFLINLLVPCVKFFLLITLLLNTITSPGNTSISQFGETSV